MVIDSFFAFIIPTSIFLLLLSVYAIREQQKYLKKQRKQQ